MTPPVSRFFLVLVCLSPSLSFAWGFDGHRRLAALMQDPLPANLCLRTWLASKQTYALQNSSCDPDRWRTGSNADPLEAPRHYLEIDYATPITGYPRDYAAAITRFGAKYAAENGQVPWRVEEMYNQLVAAFRADRSNQAAYEAEILRIAFVLSHYVTDSHSVLHNTKTFDPNNGLHSRWESDMLQKVANVNELSTLAATFYGTPGIADPRNNTFDEVITGNALVPQLIAFDRIASGDGGIYNQDTYEITKLYDLSKDLTARRWADALTVLSSLLWTAWAQAGSPELSGFDATCSRAQPSGEIVLRGYPTVFTHPGDGGIVLPDGGAMPVLDAGSVVDAGALAPVDAGIEPVDAGGSTGGGQGGGGGGGVTEEPEGCGCAQADLNSAVLFGGLMLALLLRRRSA